MTTPITFTLPNGRVVTTNYPMPETRPIAPARAPAIEITRIDIFKTDTGVVVNKLGYNPKFAKTIILESKTHGAFDVEAALDWCAGAGWTVRRFPGGARAWRNGLEPVRDAAEIRRLRQSLSDRPRPEIPNPWALDLAYDL